MKSLNSEHFISVFLLSSLLYSLNLNSQIANSEILDHTEHRTILTSFTENEGDIVYVIENDRRGYSSTQVKVSRNNEQPINILSEDFNYRTESKCFYDSNNKLRIYLWGLADAGIDNFSTDFIEIKKENNTYISKRITNPFMISLEGVISIALDSSDNIYTLTNYPRLQLFESDTLKKELFPNISHNSKLHANEIGDVYLLDSGLDTIFKVNNLQMDYVTTLELDVKEVKNIEGSIWVLTEDNKLYMYGPKFQSLPQYIPLTFTIKSLDQISENETGVYFMEHLNNGFKIHTYSSGTITELKEYKEDYGNSTKLHSINDSLFLSSGQFEIADIANHAFIRGYNLNQEFSAIRANMNLDEFKLSYLEDAIIPGAPEDLWLYKVNYNLENLGDSNTIFNSIYTSHLVPGFSFSHYFFEQHLNNTIAASESQSIDTTKLIAYYHPSAATASITGSDYKFNISYTPIQIGITTSVSDLYATSKTKVYPNPFSNYLNIEGVSNQNISLHNSNGDRVYSGTVNNLQLIDLENLSQGNYYLTLPDTGELIKLIKISNKR